jgi:ADP-heptose:LPS heptosyltransferase
MKVDTQRMIDRFAGAAICRILSLFNRGSKKDGGTVKAEKILIILLSEMGSLILAHPMYQALKKKFPDAGLYFLLFEKNREVLELLEVTAAENILTIGNESMTQFARDSFVAISRMRRLKFDVVIDCELFSRISSIFSFLSGAPIRAGFHRHTQEGLYRGNFVNRPVLYNPYYHISQQFLTLVEALDSSSRPKAKRLVTDEEPAARVVTFDPNEIELSKQQLVAFAPKIEGKRIVLIYPGGGLLPIRAWPLDYYCRISKELIRQGYAVAVIGLAEDKALAKTILSHCHDADCIDLTGYTKTIRELMAIFHYAALLITNDGGPGQFAALTPIATIVFFGPETPRLYGTMGANAVNFHLPLSCSPCLTAYNHRNSPCDGDNQCLKKIHPDQVLAKAMEILEGPEK